MKKINLKNLFKKNLVTFLILLFALGFLSYSQNTFAVVSGVATDEAVKSIENIGNNGKGLIPDCGRTLPGVITDKQCSPKDAVKLIVDIARVVVYLLIISLVLRLLVFAIGYIYRGENPEYLKKWKKGLNSIILSLLILMLMFPLLLGFLSTLGLNSDLLDFSRQIFAFNDFSFFTHAVAQEIPAISSGNSGYVNFFPQQTIGSLILLTIKFLINYIAGPILVVSVIFTGFMFVRAQGNSTELDKAKKFAMRVVLAIAITAAAQMLVMILLNTIKDVSSQAGGVVNNSNTASTTSN